MYQMLKDLTRRNCPKARTRPECFPFQSIADLLAFDHVTDEVFEDVVSIRIFNNFFLLLFLILKKSF